MPLTLFPAVDIRDGRAVRLTQGVVDADLATDPVAVARSFADQGAEWLHVVDLDAAFGGPARNRHLVAEIAAATGLPVQASGGIVTPADVDAAIGYGARRVVLATAALADPGVVAAAIEAHGDRVAVGLDHDGDTLRGRGSSTPSGDLFDTVAWCTDLGVSRFVVTDVARDGMLRGPDLAGLRAVADATTAQVTASGGVSNLDDLRALAAVHERVDAAVVGKALYALRFDLADALAATR